MPRVIEIEDLPWLPAAFRGYLTDVLSFAWRSQLHRMPVVRQVKRLLDPGGRDRIIDLCSGSAGPVLRLCEELEAACGRPIRALLTDKYPNVEAFERVKAGAGGKVDFIAGSVDATAVPADLDGVRTMFASFHHFGPGQAKAILRNAAVSRQPIGIFEGTERSLSGLLMTLGTPFFVLAATPLVRPFRAGRLFWTYLVPVVPLLVSWDGFASCLRTYSVKELEALAASASADGYKWEAGRARIGWTPFHMTYLLGRPVGSSG